MRVFDFFSGCGGTSLGFQQFGFEIVAAIDFDKDCASTYRSNFPMAAFIEEDIRNVDESRLAPLIKDRSIPLLFCGCAPCQPFSGQRKFQLENDPRRSLLSEFQRFIAYWQPEYVFLENVPGIQNLNKSEGVFNEFEKMLTKSGYFHESKVVKASDYGVPQSRNRLILVAGKEPIKPILSAAINSSETSLRVRDFIEDLPAINAGEEHPKILNHAAANLSKNNLSRIRSTPEGGDRRDWPDELKIVSHTNYNGHSDVYGRMHWDRLAPTLTTRCISYSNGRFGHPEQDRAISVREAARLQTFPDNFHFTGSLVSSAKQVGNAVPPKMARLLSTCFV